MSVTIRKGRALENLSLTPLIDVVFLLLIFFLVATKFAEEERELEVLLPDASEAQPLTTIPRELFINIDREGRYFVSGRFLDLAELDQVLRAARSDPAGPRSAVIRADQHSEWVHIAAAANACKAADIHDIRFATRGPG